MPTARFFYHPLLIVLGKMTDFKPKKFVDFQEVRKRVLEHTHLDPEDLPHDWPLDGRPSIHRKIDDAFRNQKSGKHFRKSETALTLPGPKRGQWGLTPLGAEKARDLWNELREDSDEAPEEEPLEEEESEDDDENDPEDGEGSGGADGGNNEEPEADASSDLNAKEQGVLDELRAREHETTLVDLASSCFPDIWEENQVRARRQVSNSVRRLVERGLIVQVGKGLYQVQSSTSPRKTYEKPGTYQDTVTGIMGILTNYDAKEILHSGTICEAVLGQLGGDPKTVRSSVQQALSAQSKRKNRVYTTSHGKGMWSLTGEGVSHALSLNGLPPNLTAWWMEKNPRFYRAFLAKVKKKLKASANMDLVADHVHTFIVKLIERDGLRKKLASGGHYSVSQVASYCVRSAFTDIRGWGTDAHCRALRGARTEQERKKGLTKDQEQSWGIPQGRLSIRRDTEGEQYIEYIDQDTIDEQEVRDSFLSLLADIDQFLSTRRPKVRDTYLEVVRCLSQGATAQDIAEVTGRSKGWASNAVSDIKKLFQEAKETGDFSFGI